MRRLIIVSNRVADPTNAAQSGGLAVAVSDALDAVEGIWFGWSGTTVEDDADFGVKLERHGKVTLATVPLTAEEYENYYLGYSNRSLWPVFHHRLDLAEFDSAALESYKTVNKRFADVLAALIEPDDIIWIHDYQMIPLAALLRMQGVSNKIGFFLHIPFPSPEIIMAVPDHRWLLDCMFAYDLVGFQTEGDKVNFERYVEQTADKVSAVSDPFRYQKRGTKFASFPIGIDVDAFAAMARTPKADKVIARLKSGDIRHHILGVDRLDYSKGLPDRFRSYRRFLERYEEACDQKQTALLQIAPPTREELTAYSDIREELEQLSGAINGDFGDYDWTPIQYIHRSLPRSTLAALCRGSSVGLVTPLRDGMNLVAKEYVAAQDPDNPGVLVLSQFAGAAAEMKEALIVNPYDQDEVADALKSAVSMGLDERQRRHAALLERISTNDVSAWRNAFLSMLTGE
jgi:trehalose 6-phosphate synthase